MKLNYINVIFEFAILHFDFMKRSEQFNSQFGILWHVVINCPKIEYDNSCDTR